MHIVSCNHPGKQLQTPAASAFFEDINSPLDHTIVDSWNGLGWRDINDHLIAEPMP